MGVNVRSFHTHSAQTHIKSIVSAFIRIPALKVGVFGPSSDTGDVIDGKLGLVMESSKLVHTHVVCRPWKSPSCPLCQQRQVPMFQSQKLTNSQVRVKAAHKLTLIRKSKAIENLNDLCGKGQSRSNGLESNLPRYN